TKPKADVTSVNQFDLHTVFGLEQRKRHLLSPTDCINNHVLESAVIHPTCKRETYFVYGKKDMASCVVCGKTEKGLDMRPGQCGGCCGGRRSRIWKYRRRACYRIVSLGGLLPGAYSFLTERTEYFLGFAV